MYTKNIQLRYLHFQDGYPVYDKIAEKSEDITLAGCLVHAKRKFHEALDNDRCRAEKELAIFRNIYKEEKKIKDKANGDLQKIKNVYVNPKVVHLLLEKYTISPLSKYKFFTLITNDKHVYKTRNNIT